MQAAITHSDQIKDWQFNLFMINTLAFQLEKWADMPLGMPLKKENREVIKHLRNKCRKLNEINNVRPLSPVEEELYEVGDEFHAILGQIQKANTGAGNTAFAFSMLSVCTALATENVEELQDFWHKLGIYISQLKVSKNERPA